MNALRTLYGWQYSVLMHPGHTPRLSKRRNLELPRLLVLEFEGVLFPPTEPPPTRKMLWLPVLESLLEPWEDVRLVVISSHGYTPAVADLRGLLGGLSHRLMGNTIGMLRGDAVDASVRVINGGQVEHLVLVSNDDELRSGRLNLVVCDPALGISSIEVQATVKAWLRQTAP